MGEVSIILDRILFLFLIIIIGFFAFKTKYLSGNVKTALSIYVLRISVPALLISSMSAVEMKEGMLLSALRVLLISYALVFLMLGIGRLTAAVFRFRGAKMVTHKYLSALGNVIFLAFPLIYGIYGEEGMFYAMIYALANDSICWTASIYELLKVGGKKEKILGNILNPSIIALLLGVFVFLTRIKFPQPIFEVLQGLGSTTTYFAMLFIGAVLADSKLSDKKSIGAAFVLSAIKLIIMPVFTIFIFRFFGFGINLVAKIVIILQVGMPCQSVFAAISEYYDGDTSYTISVILITTLLSFLTLPFVLYLTGYFALAG